MTAEIIHATGTREERIATAQRVKQGLERDLPEIAELRQQLIAAGMCADNFGSVLAFRNADIDYSRVRDDPLHFERLHAKPTITITKEIAHAIHDRQERNARPAEPVRDTRGSRRRR